MNATDIFNYAIGIFGLILAIVGIVLSVKSIKKKEPTYSIKSVNVISDYASKYENLTVAYKDEKIKNFTVSKVLFYNRGRETITKQDIDTISPLKIKAANDDGIDNTCKILDASILQVNKKSNNFNINLNRQTNPMDRETNSVNISFDYLDKNQGAVIQVVHTGLSSDNLLIDGDIKGVQKLIEISPSELYTGTPFSFTSKKIFIPTVLIALIGWYIYIFHNDIYDIFLPVRQLPESLRAVVFSLLLPIGVILLFANFLLFIYVFLFVFELFRFRRVIPKGLEKFNE